MTAQAWGSEFWVNLPVKDVGRAKAFFTALGFAFDESRSNDEMACMLLGGKQVVVMLFREAAFAGFVRSEVADAGRAAEVLLSIDAASRAAVDALVERVRKVGGTVFADPQEAAGGAMYAAGFSDPDGHRWNILWMVSPDGGSPER